MPAYPRKLKTGTKWRYMGYHQGEYYSSPAKYGSKEEAEQVFLAGKNKDTLEYCMNQFLDHLRVNVSAAKYIKEHERQCELESAQK